MVEKEEKEASAGADASFKFSKLLQGFLNSDSHGNGHTDHGVVTVGWGILNLLQSGQKHQKSEIILKLPTTIFVICGVPFSIVFYCRSQNVHRNLTAI